MKKFNIIALVLVPLCLLSGCETTNPTTTIDITPMTVQLGSMMDRLTILTKKCQQLEDQLIAKDEEIRHLHSILQADAEIIQESAKKTSGNWMPFIGILAQHQLSFFPEGIADPWTLQTWHLGMTGYEQGGVTALSGVLPQLQHQSEVVTQALDSLDSQIVKIREERDVALKELACARTTLDDMVLRLKTDIKQARQDENEKLQRETKQWQIKAANWFGGCLGILAIIFTVGVFALPAASKLFRPLAIACTIGFLCCFIIARFLSSPWFDTIACIVLAVIAIVSISWIVWSIRVAIKHNEAEVEATKTARIVPYATTLVNVINEAYKKAHDKINDMEVLDRLIFEPLSDADKTGEYDVMRHKLEVAQSEEEAATKIKSTDLVS